MKAVCHTAIGHEGIHQNSFWWCHAKALHNVAHKYQVSTLETSWNKNVKGSSRSSQCPKILCCICGTTMGYQQAQQVPVQSHANNLHFSLKWGLPTRCFLLIETLHSYFGPINQWPHIHLSKAPCSNHIFWAEVVGSYLHLTNWKLLHLSKAWFKVILWCVSCKPNSSRLKIRYEKNWKTKEKLYTNMVYNLHGLGDFQSLQICDTQMMGCLFSFVDCKTNWVCIEGMWKEASGQ